MKFNWHTSSWVCVVVVYCYKSLMRKFVAFKSISLGETVNTVLVLSVHDNIGLNLFTKKNICCSERLRGTVQSDAISGDLFQSTSLLKL